MIVVLNLFDIQKDCENVYAEYLRRVQPVMDRHRAKVLLYGLTRMIHQGSCSQEFCGLIAYEDIESLRSFSRDPEFNELRSLRDSSTSNYVMTTIEDFTSMLDAAEYLETRAARRNAQE